MKGARRVREFLGDEEPCVYRPAERARMLYRYVEGASPELYQRLLERGWRRFGRLFFRPACALCGECRSLRVDVAGFRPTRSMKRNRAKNSDLSVRVARPGLSSAHLDLYRRYHADMSERKGWPEHEGRPLDYHRTFIEGFESFGHELQIRRGERLLAVALFDRLPAALSAVYCYYDPRARARGLGVFAVLEQIALARRLELPWVYLGFRVADNPSMAYKARYRPHELLDERAGDGSDLRWRPVV